MMWLHDLQLIVSTIAGIIAVIGPAIAIGRKHVKRWIHDAVAQVVPHLVNGNESVAHYAHQARDAACEAKDAAVEAKEASIDAKDAALEAKDAALDVRTYIRSLPAIDSNAGTGRGHGSRRSPATE